MTIPEYTLTDPDGDQLFVAPATPARHKQTVAEVYLENSPNSVYVTKEDAPALALALLELSGWTADHVGGKVEHAVANLSKHIKQKAEEDAARAAKAEEEAALEAEALALYNAGRRATGDSEVASFADEPLAAEWRNVWIQVASASRELYGVPALADPSPCCVTFDCE